MAVLQEYKCPCCGGAIEFDSRVQKMKCPYCDTEFEMETLRGYDEDLRTDTADDMTWESAPGGEWDDGETRDMRVYVCRSCGGEIVGDATTAATTCPYCNNPVVMTGQLSGMLKPDLVIPFKLDKAAAKAGLKRHLQGKRLLPKVFSSESHIDEIKGIYVPFWLFDAEAEANIRYRATRTRFWSDSRNDYTETSFYSVLRAGTLSFDAVPVDGSEKMADELMESIEPFDLSEAVDFQTAYLAGYFADKYDVTAEQSVARANERIRESTARSFAETVHGFNTVTPEASSISLSSGKTHYALYPVWMLTTTWRGEKYVFAMNGQTGKFVGNLPVDKSALRRWLWGITAIGTVALTAAQFLLWLL